MPFFNGASRRYCTSMDFQFHVQSTKQDTASSWNSSTLIRCMSTLMSLIKLQPTWHVSYTLLQFYSRQIAEIPSPGKLYSQLMDVIVRFAHAGLIHGDFNEFNILIREESGEPVVIDFPQMVSTSHVNAEWFVEHSTVKYWLMKLFVHTSGISIEMSNVSVDSSRDDFDMKALCIRDLGRSLLRERKRLDLSWTLWSQRLVSGARSRRCWKRCAVLLSSIWCSMCSSGFSIWMPSRRTVKFLAIARKWPNLNRSE